MSVVLKKKSLKANKKIHDYIISQVEDWQTVSQSKWWLPISKMWLVLDESKLDKKIKKLFISSNGAKTQWDKLGIIKFLKDKST